MAKSNISYQFKSNESNKNKNQTNQIKNDQNFHFNSAHTDPIDNQYSSKVRSPEESTFFKTLMFSFHPSHFRRCAPEFLRRSEIVSPANYLALFAALFVSSIIPALNGIVGTQFFWPVPYVPHFRGIVTNQKFRSSSISGYFCSNSVVGCKGQNSPIFGPI